MPTGDRGGAQTKTLTPKQRRSLNAALAKLKQAPATSENSRGAGKPSSTRQPATTLPTSSYGGKMARNQKPPKPGTDIGMNPADVLALGLINRRNPLSGATIGQKILKNWAELAVSSPGGTIDTGKAVAKDVSAATHGDLSFKRSRKIGVEIAKSTVEDVRHPARRPGYFLLDLLGASGAVAGTAARVGAAGSALRAGEGLAKAAGRSSAKGGSLLHAPNPGRIKVKQSGLEVDVPAYRSPAARAVQKAYHRSKDNTPGPKRVSKALAAERRVTEPLERAPAGALAAKGKRLTTPQQKALQVVAEGKPVADRIKLHERDMVNAKPTTKLRLRREIALLRASERYVENINGAPRLRTDFETPKLGGAIRTRRGVGPEGLRSADASYAKVDAQREKTLVESGRLEPSQVEARLHGPGRVIQGAEYVKPTAARLGKPSASLQRARQRVASLQRRFDDRKVNGPRKQLLGSALSVAKDELQAMEKAAKTRTKPTGLVGAEDFKGGKKYFPYRRTQAPKSHATAQTYTGATPKAHASTTHEFTGSAMRSTNYRNRTTQVAAEAGIEAQRDGAILRLRDQVIQAGHDVHPDDGRDYVPVRTGKTRKSPTLDALRKKVEEGVTLSRQERLTLGRATEALIKHTFPDASTLTSHKGIKWVPKELLDGLNDPHAQLSAVIGSRTVKVWDAVNNATRAAVLYLKPAYAVPNILGNLALNIIQQGFAAPANLARAALAGHRLGDDAVATMRAGMGEGFAQALAGDTGIGTKAIQGLANVWSKGVDEPFRDAAFIYEARRLGYKSPVEQRALLLDDAHAADRLEAFQRANKEIIDYSRLSKREREIVRRVVFFYPWVKGSTMYASHFAVEHPIKASLIAQEGRLGQEQSQKDLGPGPSYTDGEFKVHVPGRLGELLGQKPGEPLVVNPAAAAILGTPAQVLMSGSTLASGDFRKADKLTNFLTPAAALVNDLINNRDSFTDRPLKGNLGDKLNQELVDSLPQARLVDTLLHPGKGKLHPVTRTGAIAKFGIGSIAPSPENLKTRHELAGQEGADKLSPAQKAYRSVFKERNQLHADAIDAGLIGPHDKLPEALRTAYKFKAERDAAWDTASHGKSPGSPEYQFARYQADIRFLVKHGKLDKNEVKDAVEWGNTHKADIEALKKARRWITDTYYQPGFLNEINTRKHELAAAKG